MILKILPAALLAVLMTSQPLLADEQKIAPNADGQVVFMTPSGNIGCIYTPDGGTDTYQTANGEAELICDRVMPQYVRIVLGTEGAAEGYADVGDAGCCGGKKVKYDNYIELGPFTCFSETTGLTCVREDDDTGFLLSKAKISLF